MGWRWVNENVGPKLSPRPDALTPTARSLLRPLVTAGYRAMAKKCHPDKKGGSDKKMRALVELKRWLESL